MMMVFNANRIRKMINNRIRQMTKGPEALNIESPGLVHKIQSSPFIKSNTCSLKSTGRARKYVEWQIMVSP